MRKNNRIILLTEAAKRACFTPLEIHNKAVRSRKRQGRFLSLAGFTLLELIVAVTIFAVTAVAIYSSFGVGITASRKAEESYKVRQEARHFFSIFSRDLRDAVNFTLLVDPADQNNFKDSLEGSADRVTFWRPLRIKGEGSKRMIRLTYYIKNDGMGPDGTETKSVYRKLQAYEDIVKDEEAAGTESAMVSGISGFELEYIYFTGEEIVWDKQWKKNDETAICTLPFAVKVSLAYPLKDGDKTVKFFETVVIPTGSMNEKTGSAP